MLQAVKDKIVEQVLHPAEKSENKEPPEEEADLEAGAEDAGAEGGEEEAEKVEDGIVEADDKNDVDWTVLKVGETDLIRQIFKKNEPNIRCTKLASLWEVGLFKTMMHRY